MTLVKRETRQSDPNQITIYASRLFNSRTKSFLQDVSVIVNTETGLISSIEELESLPKSIKSPDIDLTKKTIFPGLVDAHTHIFLHSYSDTPSINQERDESTVERVLRASNHCRAALLAGYTTYRDLGTEGLGNADVNFRDAVNRGIVPGPRLLVATECIASSGGYEIRIESAGKTSVPRISDPADGVDGVRAAVRRRIGAGADIVKFYADYRKRQLRFPPAAWKGAEEIKFVPQERNPSLVLFTQEEMNTMVQEARDAKAPIAAHAQSQEAVIRAAKAGVTTIEHGCDPGDEALLAMQSNGTIFVPTLAVLETAYHGEAFKAILAHTKKAFDMGIKLASGGDTGAFDHGHNVREMELLVEAGIPILDVLQAATLHGWEACGGDLCGRNFGSLEIGSAADIVAFDDDPTINCSALRRVDFVMKDGQIWKQNGHARGMI